MPEPTQETLASWLQGVVATVPDAEAIKGFHAAVVAGAKVSGPQILDVVALSHRAASNEKIDWFANLARSKGAPTPSVGNNKALVTRLASASIVYLATSGGQPAIVAGLATQSAAFLGLTPDLPEVITFADDAIAREGDAVRTRRLTYESTAPKVSGWVDQGSTPPPEGTPPSERPQWEAPVIAVAKQLDALAGDIRARLELLDEEYDLLWWSHAGRSVTVDLPWGDVLPPERRVILVGRELGERTRTPATAMVDGLAAVALGEMAAEELALADVVAAAREEMVGIAGAGHALLPISTAVTQAGIYDDDDTWKKVVKKTHGIDVSVKRSAAAIARQLIRERQLGKFL